MDQIFKNYKQHGVEVLFIYTKEAHPGENYPLAHSFDQKMAHALTFKKKNRIQRPIWIDSWDEYAHKLYGYGPNMSFLIDRSGIVVFKANWTKAAQIRETVDDILKAEAAEANGETIAFFCLERIYPGVVPVEMYIEGLKRNGPKALLDVGIKHLIEQGHLMKKG